MFNGEVEQWAEPAVDGSEEAKQVDMFLNSEHAVMQKAFDEDLGGAGERVASPPDIEVPVLKMIRCTDLFRLLAQTSVVYTHSMAE